MLLNWLRQHNKGAHMNEQTVLHRIYRECVDSVNDIWRRVSFWTQAVDVDLRQGETVQYRLGNLDLDSTKSKTLIEEYIEEAAEQHRLLTAQLDRLEDEIAARIPGLGMLTDTYKIIADANPEAVTAYEARLAEAREEVAAMIKPVEDELERLRGLLTGAIGNVEGDPLSDDILQRIEALRTKTNNDVADVNTNYIGSGFDPGVKAIGNSLTDAILNQEFNIHSVGAKFWEFYGFLGDEVVSSEDLYELETVDGMNVLDFLSGSYVNIDYNRKLNLCYIRGWVKIPFSDCYFSSSSGGGSGPSTSVFGPKSNIALGVIGLIDIFPKADESGQVELNMGIKYACIEYSNGFIYKINSYLSSQDAHVCITNHLNSSSRECCDVIIPFLMEIEAIFTFYDSTSSTFGDEGEGSDTSTPEYVWVYFEDGYFDNAYVQPEKDLSFAPLENYSNDITGLLTGYNDYMVIPKAGVTYPIQLSNHSATPNTKNSFTAPIIFSPDLIWIYADKENDYTPEARNGDRFFLVFDKGLATEKRIELYLGGRVIQNQRMPITYQPFLDAALVHLGAPKGLLSVLLARRNNNYINYTYGYGSEIRDPIENFRMISLYRYNGTDSEQISRYGNLYNNNYDSAISFMSSTGYTDKSINLTHDNTTPNYSTVTVEWPNTNVTSPSSHIMGLAFNSVFTTYYLYEPLQGSSDYSAYVNYVYNDVAYFALKTSWIQEGKDVSVYYRGNYNSSTNSFKGDFINIATPYVRGSAEQGDEIDMIQPQSGHVIYKVSLPAGTSTTDLFEFIINFTSGGG